MNKVKQAKATGGGMSTIVFVLYFGVGFVLFWAFLPGWLANFIIAPVMAEHLAVPINILSAFMGGMSFCIAGLFIQMVVSDMVSKLRRRARLYPNKLTGAEK